MQTTSRKLLAMIAAVVLLASALTGCAKPKPEITVAHDLYDLPIDVDGLGAIITELTSSDYAGRLAGSQGNRRAADFIADYFAEVGLEAPPGLTDYRQPYRQPVRIDHAASVLELVDDEGKSMSDFVVYQDFRTEANWPGLRMNGDITGEVMLVDRSASGRHPGKIALYPLSATGGATGEALGRQVLTALRTTGMTAAVIERSLNPDRYTKAYFPIAGTIRDADPDPEGEMIFYASSAAFATISERAAKGAKLHLSADSELAEVDAANVIGYIPGSSAALKDSPIIISGHFDGLGPNHDGTHNPGGLDNVSGTAAVMALAKILRASDVTPRRPIVFAALNGEEEGLWGSSAYVSNPVWPLKDTVVINMDMVGSDEDQPLEVLIARTSQAERELQSRLCDYADSIGLAVTKGTSTYGYDHISFSDSGVAAVSLAEDDFDYYHSPDDTAANVDLHRLEQVVRLVLYYLDQTAFGE